MAPPLTEFQLPKHFCPKIVEKRWADHWDEHQLWRADPNSAKPPFCMVLPPPNVTGVLHMGHALTVAIEDCIARYKRMRGFEVLWVPGLDHAGIATQTIVERHLLEKEGKSKSSMTRGEFLNRVWEWKERHQQVILDQIKRLGASCDWSRLCFSLDEPRSQAVNCAFHRLYDQGLIYRDHYLVNWDPLTQTALSDDEVEYEEREGQLWTLRYQLESGLSELHVATTRPETLLGDTALAVSPRDPRYAPFVGARARVPIVDRLIPIVADDAVSAEFGTGVVKVTPAHDPLDYQIGRRHELDAIEVIGPDGAMRCPPDAKSLPYAGFSADRAREMICADLQKAGAMVTSQTHSHRVGLSYRSRAVVEPRLSKQWFFKLSAFRSLLRQAVEGGGIALIPPTFRATYFHWVDGLRDWCISRQLWWGHQIPVWHHRASGEMICAESSELPEEVRQTPGDWARDEDVLDTWFSSALWPLSALGWPNRSALLEKFYPNQLLETGCDILFFWVARMAILGRLNEGRWPFAQCYLHGLIYSKSYWRSAPGGGIRYVSDQERAQYDLGSQPPRDVQSRWEKMSKSKGNVINPLEIAELYGTDAARMALLASAIKLPQIDLDRRKFEEFKHFANKIWNGARFVLHAIQSPPALTPRFFAEELDEGELALEDRWFLGALRGVISRVQGHLDRLDLDRAAMTAYEFYWGEFCAQYLEVAKPTLADLQAPDRRHKQKILALGLLALVRLIHPMAPYISEEIFSHLKRQLSGGVSPNSDSLTKEGQSALCANCCMTSPWPDLGSSGASAQLDQERFEHLIHVARALRNVRAELKIPPGVSLQICAHMGDADWGEFQSQHHIARALTRIESVKRVFEEPKQPCALAQIDRARFFVLLPESFLSQERQRLSRELAKLDAKIAKLREFLEDPNLAQRAPSTVLEQRSAQLQSLQASRDQMVLATERISKGH